MKDFLEYVGLTLVAIVLATIFTMLLFLACVMEGIK